jgi:hypothetical protein
VESTLRVPYARPYSKMVEYLDALDQADPPVPAGVRMLAALGRVRAHHDAGADHVCIYVIGGTHEELQLEAWRRLAPALVSR